MADFFKVSLISGNQRFQTFLGDRLFNISIQYRDAEIGGGWYMDLQLADESASLLGVPMLIGVDLLAQYQYLTWGRLWVTDDSGVNDLSKYENMTPNVGLVWSGDA